MANKKKNKANSQDPTVDLAASDRSAKDVGTVPGEKEAKTKKNAKDPEKGKEKTVNKSQARAKDSKKAAKKPNIIQRFFEYIKQVRLEIKRTTWPTKNEVLNMTIIVLVALVFFGGFIFLIDNIMVRAINQYALLVPEQAVDVGALDPSGTDAGVDAGVDVGTDATGEVDPGTVDPGTVDPSTVDPNQTGTDTIDPGAETPSAESGDGE